MKKLFPLLFVFLLAFNVFAFSPNPNARISVIDINISSALEITSVDPFSPRPDYVNLDVFFFPKTDNKQNVLSISSIPEGERKDSFIHFNWKVPQQKLLPFEINSRVRVENSYPAVFSKMDFPLRLDGIPDHIKPYLSASEIIDSDNSEIRRVAFSLAENENDLFVLVTKIGEWVKASVKYDLSTLNIQASNKASVVLKNRDGVCDEITSLFMALLRSLGIPAKFVSGMVYTNSPLFADAWQAHGWAEVYFPEYGWVPFDVTFGQFGWVDSTHVKLLEGIDAKEKSFVFSWKSENSRISAGEIDVDGKLVEQVGDIGSFLSFSGKLVKESVGFGSYTALVLEIKNLNNFYYATEIKMAEVAELEKLDKSVVVALTPKETKKFVWKFKVKENLDQKFMYKIPVVFYTSHNESLSLELNANVREKVYSLNDITRELSFFSEQSEKVSSKKIDLSCFPDKNYFYPYEKVSVSCTLINLVNQAFKRIEVCLINDCNYVDLGIAATKNFVFELANLGYYGKHEFSVVARNDELVQKSVFFIDVFELPKLEFSSLKYSDTVAYKKDLIIDAIVLLNSKSSVQNVSVEVSNKHKTQIFVLEDFLNEKSVSLKVPSNMVSDNLYLKLKWQDLNGQWYKFEKEIPVVIEGKYFWNKLIDFFLEFFQSLKESFS